MAAPKRRRRRARRLATNTRRRRRNYSAHRRRRHAAAAPVRHRRRRRANTRHRRRRNAGRTSTGVFSSVTHIGVSLAAAFGSKLLTQAILGANNVGFTGYIGNGVATAAIAMVAKMFGYGRFVNAIVAGGAIQIGIRLATDYSLPGASMLQKTGLGDYQISNWVTPQRYVDPMNSAMVEIPPGWAPKMLPAANGKGMGWAGDYDGLYGATSGGLYQ